MIHIVAHRSQIAPNAILQSELFILAEAIDRFALRNAIIHPCSTSVTIESQYQLCIQVARTVIASIVQITAIVAFAIRRVCFEESSILSSTNIHDSASVAGIASRNHCRPLNNASCGTISVHTVRIYAQVHKIAM